MSVRAVTTCVKPLTALKNNLERPGQFQGHKKMAILSPYL